MGVPLSDLIDPSKRAELQALAAAGGESKNPESIEIGLADAAMRDALTVDTAEASLELKMTHEPLDRSPKHNWVEDAGGLPAYIQHIAKDISEKRGMPLSRAIPIAIGAVKRWARGGGDVNADTRAKAAAAVAEWEALKAKNKAKGAAKDASKADDAPLEVKADDGTDETKIANVAAHMLISGGRHVRTPEGSRKYHEPIGGPIHGGTRFTHKQGHSVVVHAQQGMLGLGGVYGTREAPAGKEHLIRALDKHVLEVELNAMTHDPDWTRHDPPKKRLFGRKDDADDLEYKDPSEPTGELEHKSAGPGTAVLSTDDETGIVEALVSVTGVADRVDDIIEPGAYASTLATHEPIGVWSHDDKTWVARAEEVKELSPGDPMLPERMQNGQPWPKEAGALYVKSRFNLETPHGAAAYSDVKFFKGKTGWSIGYRVTNSKRDVRTGVRRIKSLNLFEFSPVMVGAAPQSMTLSVKSLSQPVDPDAVPEVDVEHLGNDEVKALLDARDALFASLDLETKGRFVEALHPRNHGKFSSKPGEGGVAKIATGLDAPRGVEGGVGPVPNDGSVAPLLDVVPPAYAKGMPQALKTKLGKGKHHLNALKAAQIEALVTFGVAETMAHIAEHHELIAPGTANLGTTLGVAAMFALHKSIKHGAKEEKADPAATDAPADAPADGESLDPAAQQAVGAVIQDEVEQLGDVELTDDVWNELIGNVVDRLSEAIQQLGPQLADDSTADAPPVAAPTPPAPAPAATAETKDLLANLEAKAHWTENLTTSRPPAGAQQAKGGKAAQPTPAEVSSDGKRAGLADQMHARAREAFRQGAQSGLSGEARQAHVAMGEGLLDGEQVIRNGGGHAELGAAAAKAKAEDKHPMHVEALMAAAADHHEASEHMDDDELNAIAGSGELYPAERDLIESARALPPEKRRQHLREASGFKYLGELDGILDAVVAEVKGDRFVRTARGAAHFHESVGSRIGDDLPTRPDENSDVVREHAYDMGISNEAAADELHELALEAHHASAPSLAERLGRKPAPLRGYGHQLRALAQEDPEAFRGVDVEEAVKRGGLDDRGALGLDITRGLNEAGLDMPSAHAITDKLHDFVDRNFRAEQDWMDKARDADPLRRSKDVAADFDPHGLDPLSLKPGDKISVSGRPHTVTRVESDEMEPFLHVHATDDELHGLAGDAPNPMFNSFERYLTVNGSTPRIKRGAGSKDAGLDLEGKDVFTASGPAQKTTGFGGGTNGGVIGRGEPTLAKARPRCPSCGSKSVTMIGGRRCAMCGTPVGKPAEAGEAAVNVDQKAWSPASRIAALAARRAHRHAAVPEPDRDHHVGPRLTSGEHPRVAPAEGAVEQAASEGAAHAAAHLAHGVDHGHVRTRPHEGSSHHEVVGAGGTILGLHRSPEEAAAYAKAYNEAHKRTSHKADEPLEQSETGLVHINEHEILAASRLRLLVD